MTGFLRRFFGTSPEPSSSATLDEAIRAAAERFARWATRASGKAVPLNLDSIAHVDDVFAALRTSSGGELTESLASDAAAFLGEVFRARWGGAWQEDDRFGLVVSGVLDTPSKLMPLALVEKKWEAPTAFALSSFFAALDQRIETERTMPPLSIESKCPLADRLRGKSASDAQSAVDACVTAFREAWKRRHRVDLPLTLNGVREIDRFLRTHYFISFVDDAALIHAGLFVGDVGRGLFEGKWDFTSLPGIESAALRFPELDYLPIGRIFKMMTGRPEGEPLDEYIRLIPSARRELRARPDSH